MQDSIIQLIERDRGVEDAEKFRSYSGDPQLTAVQAASVTLERTKLGAKACVFLSVTFAKVLQECFNIPAFVAAGDLLIENKKIFTCSSNLPDVDPDSPIRTFQEWEGHCWVEFPGFLGDLSVFKTANKLSRNHPLRSFVRKKFKEEGDFLIRERNRIPRKMSYIPKYIINQNQVEVFYNSMVSLLGPALL